MTPPIDRLTGINAVREALQAGSAIDRIVIARGRQDTRMEEIVQLARAAGFRCGLKIAGRSIGWQIPKIIRELWRWRRRGRPDRWKIFWRTRKRTLAGSGGLIVLLDGVEDPHNLGAIDSHGAGGGRARRGDSGAARGGADGYGGARVGWSAGASAGGAGDESGAGDGGVEGSGILAGGIG